MADITADQLVSFVEDYTRPLSESLLRLKSEYLHPYVIMWGTIDGSTPDGGGTGGGITGSSGGTDYIGDGFSGSNYKRLNTVEVHTIANVINSINNAIITYESTLMKGSTAADYTDNDIVYHTP